MWDSGGNSMYRNDRMGESMLVIGDCLALDCHC